MITKVAALAEHSLAAVIFAAEEKFKAVSFFVADLNYFMPFSRDSFKLFYKGRRICLFKPIT